jgi:hypothetical protein
MSHATVRPGRGTVQGCWRTPQKLAASSPRTRRRAFSSTPWCPQAGAALSRCVAGFLRQQRPAGGVGMTKAQVPGQLDQNEAGLLACKPHLGPPSSSLDQVIEHPEGDGDAVDVDLSFLVSERHPLQALLDIEIVSHTPEILHATHSHCMALGRLRRAGRLLLPMCFSCNT